VEDDPLKKIFKRLKKNELFRVLVIGVIMYVSMVAMILITIKIPPEAILDSNLVEIIKIFED